MLFKIARVHFPESTSKQVASSAAATMSTLLLPMCMFRYSIFALGKYVKCHAHVPDRRPTWTRVLLMSHFVERKQACEVRLVTWHMCTTIKSERHFGAGVYPGISKGRHLSLRSTYLLGSKVWGILHIQNESHTSFWCVLSRKTL
jgi:hypothetical protein